MNIPMVTRLLFNLELWVCARFLSWQIPRDSLEKVLKLASPAEPASYRGLPASYVAGRVMRVLRRPWLMRDRRCLRQGVLGFRFLRKAGHRPRLYFGVDRDSFTADKLSAHCWVEVDGETVLGFQERPMLIVHVHPHGETSRL